MQTIFLFHCNLKLMKIADIQRNVYEYYIFEAKTLNQLTILQINENAEKDAWIDSAPTVFSESGLQQAFLFT